MHCALCQRPIERYDPAFHHLVIDSAHAVDICAECADKFVKWQGSKIASLFPTKRMKKMYDGK